MNERPTFLLDGVEVPFEPGQTVMQAALSAGVVQVAIRRPFTFAVHTLQLPCGVNSGW